jgi:transposase
MKLTSDTMTDNGIVGGGKLKTDTSMMLDFKLASKRGSESRGQDNGEVERSFVRLSRLEECFIFFHDLGRPPTLRSFQSRRVSMSPRPKKKSSSHASAVSLHNPNAAGIDIGATELYVAVPADRADAPVRCFNSFTEDLVALAEWLKTCGITSVAMESTGVYWIPAFQILEDRGFEVCLVNARHVKNVPGRKSDVQDCQWLQYLHSVGLLRGSFRPPQQVCALRALMRHRQTLVTMASAHIQHMQKALTQMNLQIHHVLSDITGNTGLDIIDAILAGERNPEKLAKLRDCRVRASQATVRKALVGDYRMEHLFTLDQSLKSFRHYQELIAECEQKIQSLLAALESQLDPLRTPLPQNDKRSCKKKTGADFALRQELFRTTGVDLTAIPGIQATTAQTLLSEIGSDVSRFPSDKHFASWLRLCPDNRISGGRILSTQSGSGKNRAATALCVVAASLHHNQTVLGHFLRRMRAKLGAQEAIVATAHKLARIIYHMLKTKQPYDETRFAHHEEQHRRRMEVKLKHQAKAMGFALVPA